MSFLEALLQNTTPPMKRERDILEELKLSVDKALIEQQAKEKIKKIAEKQAKKKQESEDEDYVNMDFPPRNYNNVDYSTGGEL